MTCLINLLCRKKTHYLLKLKSELIDICDIKLIKDNKEKSEKCIYKNFTNLVTIKKEPCAWEISFLNIFSKKLHKKYEYFYFIEDDVYSKNIKTFKKLIKKLNNRDEDLISNYITPKKNMNDWMHWEPQKENTKMFSQDELCFSFNPFCRLSSRLVREIFKFKKIHKKLLFHEILFASICVQKKLKTKCITKIKNSNFGEFVSRPIILKESIKDNKIYHPVKNI